MLGCRMTQQAVAHVPSITVTAQMLVREGTVVIVKMQMSKIIVLRENFQGKDMQIYLPF